MSKEQEETHSDPVLSSILTIFTITISFLLSLPFLRPLVPFPLSLPHSLSLSPDIINSLSFFHYF